MQSASGKVAEALARHFDKVYMCAPVVREGPRQAFDEPLDATKLELIAQPFWTTTADSLSHLFGIASAYARTCRQADVLFVRGMCPYTAVLYAFAAMYRKPVCHWIVGDTVSLLRTGVRRGRVFDALALFYALQDRLITRVGRRLTNGALICNGRKLAQAYPSPRTVEVVSSTTEEQEFFHRTDTCQGRLIRILFVGFIRPEKGIEYLLDAVSRLKPDVLWELEIVGPDEFPKYRKKLDAIVSERGLRDRIRWSGYVPNGQPLLERMRSADLFVLPTVSEGTPHVLVEARANGLPCVSTSAGGVPTTVTDGFDALLVPPKDPQALALAVERVIRDEDLRRALIRNGLAAARKQTLGRFIGTVVRELNTTIRVAGEVVAD